MPGADWGAHDPNTLEREQPRIRFRLPFRLRLPLRLRKHLPNEFVGCDFPLPKPGPFRVPGADWGAHDPNTPEREQPRIRLPLRLRKHLPNEFMGCDFSLPEPGPFPVPGTGCGAHGPKDYGPGARGFRPRTGPARQGSSLCA